MILTVRQREIEIVGGRTRKTTSQPMSGRWRDGLRFCESERNRYRDATQTSTNEGEWRVFFWVKEKIENEKQENRHFVCTNIGPTNRI